MDTSNLELTPAQREALLAQPDAPVYIADQADAEDLHALSSRAAFRSSKRSTSATDSKRLAAIDRGEVEDWDSASIKAEGRKIQRRHRILSDCHASHHPYPRIENDLIADLAVHCAGQCLTPPTRLIDRSNELEFTARVSH